jgi:chromosome segregation protein
MKLSFIEVAGFRGFKEPARLEIGSGFSVLTGRNGVGKSTAFDAVEFALTGTISKFSVEKAKGGGLQEHLWWVGTGKAPAHYVKVGFLDRAGNIHTVTRTREGGLETQLGGIGEQLCGPLSHNIDWASTLVQTTLIRDETIAAFSLDMPEQARFNAVRSAIGGLSGADPTKRIQSIISAAEAALEAQKLRVTQAETEVGRTLSALTEARSAAALEADVGTATDIVKKLAPDLATDDLELTGKLRTLIATRKRTVVELQNALSQVQELLTGGERVEPNTDELERAASEIRSVALGLKKQFEQKQEILEAEHATDRFAENMLGLIRHGEVLGLQHGHCPLCAAERSDDEFRRAIADARAQLSERGERIATLTSEVEGARSKLDAALRQQQLAEVSLRAAREQMERRSAVLTNVSTIYGRHGVTAAPEDVAGAREQILARQEHNAELEQALLIFESSSAQEKIASIDSRLSQLRAVLEAEMAALNSAQRAAEAAKRLLESSRLLSNQILTEQFDTVLPLLKELYVRLRPHADWQDIELDFGGKVRASLNFTVGDGKNPQFLFSSGQRRAAGLAFLLAIHLSRPWCGLNALFLDDPIQHIDDYRALNLVEVLAAIRKTGRQIVVAVEDAALADVLCRRLRSTATEVGNRIEMETLVTGSAGVVSTQLIPPLIPKTISFAEAS